MFELSNTLPKNSKIDVHGPHMNQEFQPYANNSGNVVAIGGDGYLIIASDLRLTSGYSILTRNQSKLFKITDKVILGTNGCWCDCVSFARNLEIRAKMYKYDHNKELSGRSTAQLVSNMLFNRRFFPYYVGNIVAWLDENNQGHVADYDPVGNFEDSKCSCTGSATELIQPILDNQVDKSNIANLTEDEKKVSLEEALTLVKDAFNSAAEVEISCGDGVHCMILTKDGIKEERWPLRSD